MPPASPDTAWKRAVALLAGLSLALAVAVVVLATRPVGTPDALDLGRLDEGVRDDAVQLLVSSSRGIWDSFHDPDVGRVLQPGLEGRDYDGVPVDSNAFGLRERAFDVVPGPDTVRVVLLGDSYVFGYQVEAAERVGVHLQAALAERAGADGLEVEVLHLAASSWNVRAECAYLRRQLSLLRPDLVVQVLVENDLDDAKGARGYGSVAGFSPQHRERANGLVARRAQRRLWDDALETYLLLGLDHESRSRLERAGADVARLARDVEAVGGRYLLLGNWSAHNPLLARHVASGLRDDQVAYLSPAFADDPRFRLGRRNAHWSAAGHAEVALLLYGLCVERALLPRLALAPWSEAARVVAQVHGPGLAAARADDWLRAAQQRATNELRAALDLTALDAQAVRQVHGGLDRGDAGDAGALVAPYASLVLRNDGARELALRATRLDRPELADGSAEVWVEEHLVGRVALGGAAPVDVAFELPDALADREVVNVRLVSDDYAYRNPRGLCVALVLRSVELR